MSVLRTSPLSPWAGSPAGQEGIQRQSWEWPQAAWLPALVLPGPLRACLVSAEVAPEPHRTPRHHHPRRTRPPGHAALCPPGGRGPKTPFRPPGQAWRRFRRRTVFLCPQGVAGLGLCSRTNSPPLSAFRNARRGVSGSRSRVLHHRGTSRAFTARTLRLPSGFFDTLRPGLTAAQGPGPYTRGPRAGLAGSEGTPPPGRRAPAGGCGIRPPVLSLGSLGHPGRDRAPPARLWAWIAAPVSAPGHSKIRASAGRWRGGSGCKEQKIGPRWLEHRG